MNPNGEKFVDFEYWCPKCQHEKTADEDLPCRDCLENTVNQYSTKPTEWKEKEK